jgi:hypothetical protein
LLLDELDQALQRLDKLVVPDTEIADGAATAPLDFCRLDDNETGAAGREFSGVHQVPVGGKSLNRGILVHRWHHDAVAQLDASDGQR